MPNEKKLLDELDSIQNDLSQIERAIEKLSNKKQKLLSRKNVIKQLLQENASEKLANQNWERTDHPWSPKVFDVLKSSFKLDKFRPYQLSTINAAMSKQDCILLMPTGGGKSLCYQLPAMVFDGITLVVSPLVSLMEDQIMAMEALNIPAAMLNASSTREHVNYIQKQMVERKPSVKLLYVTPEKLAKSKRFMAKLEKMYQMGMFSLLAIDEVHCCSQWGHDFRTDYKFLGIMKRQFPKVPILGLTATATSSVIADVQKILNIPGCLVLKASFNRPNLKYEVASKSSCQKDNVQELESLIKNRFNDLSGIIYCFSVKDSEEIASELYKRNIKARAYHAQLDAKARSSVHKSWSSGSTQVIVATVAFGMGIDKPDVRFVIHYSMPKSMENFYQESGRAGRDDQPASCILFYRFPDLFRQSTMVFTEQKGLEHLYAMVSYCLDLSRCRRAIIAEHFGERWESADCQGMCDHCDKYNPFVEKTKDVSKEYESLVNILNFATSIDERLTSQKLLDALQGKGPSKLRPPGLKLSLRARENCERILALLLLESYLIEEFHFTPYSTISYINIGSRHHNVGDELTLPMPQLRSLSTNIPNDSITQSNPSVSSSSKTSHKSSPVSNSIKPSIKESNSPTKSKPSISKSKQKKIAPKLCVVSDEKSYFHKNESGSSAKRSSENNKTVPKKLKVTEEIELSDDDLYFESFDVSRKSKEGDSGVISQTKNVLNKGKMDMIIVSDSD